MNRYSTRSLLTSIGSGTRRTRERPRARPSPPVRSLAVVGEPGTRKGLWLFGAPHHARGTEPIMPSIDSEGQYMVEDRQLRQPAPWQHLASAIGVWSVVLAEIGMLVGIFLFVASIAR